MKPDEIEPLPYSNHFKNFDITNCGIASRRIYRDNTNKNLISDCFEKFCLCIIDLNNQLKLIKNLEYSGQDIIYLILTVTWMREAFLRIRNSIKPNIIDLMPPDPRMELANKFIQAVRSFVVAHPLQTTKHADLGLDGSYICLDICDVKRNAFLRCNYYAMDFQKLSFDGIQKCDDIFQEDFCLVVYSDKIDSMKYKQHIGLCFSDFYEVASIYIDRMQEINRTIKRAARNHII